MRAPARILIVDDDAFVRIVLRDLLSPEGHQLDEARDGGEAVEKVRSAAPDLVLLDLFMPNVSGIEALLRIREASPQTRVVVISSLDAPALIEQAMQAGATSFLVKPFHPLEVQGAVEQALGQGA
jgi:two-component system chemotaxis response regulator CheY